MNERGSAAPLLLIVALLAMGALLHLFSGRDGDETPVRRVSSVSQVSDWKTYRSEELEFSVRYPVDFTVNENYRYTLAIPTDPSQNPIPGVAFILPTRFFEGTNLGTDSKISVEASDDFCRVDEMQGYGGLATDISNETEELGGRVYKKIIRSDAGAGNFYNETIYSTGARSVNGNCYGIRLFLHSVNLGVLQESQPGTREYDRDGITQIFKDMIKTITFIR